MKLLPQTDVRKKNNYLYNMKLNFDYTAIRLITLSAKEFTKGMELYNDKAVFDVMLCKEFNNESLEDLIRVNAKVSDADKPALCLSVKIDRNGDILSYRCSCEEYSNHRYYYCKHIIALLLYLYNNNKASDTGIRLSSVTADTGLTDLIKHYEQRLYNETQSDINKPYIILTPKLIVNEPGFIEIGLNIGNKSKSYVVKDIFSLAENIKLSLTHQYGKNFELNHNINNFTDQSKALAKLIINLCYEYMEVYGYSYNLLPSKKSIKIHNSQLDLLFDIYSGSSVPCALNNTVFNLEFVNDNPKLCFGLYKNYTTDKYDFCLNDFFENSYHIFRFLNKVFLLYKNKFFRCNDEFVDNVMPAIDKLYQSKNLTIPIAKKNLSVFCSTVLCRLEKYAAIHIPDDIKDSLVSSPLCAKIYLDTNKSKEIYADVLFCYEKYEINPLDDTPLSADGSTIIRDMKKEMQIISNLKSCSFIEKDKKYVLNNEASIYSFIAEKVNDLIGLCEVHASESFKKIKLKVPASINMGVRLSNNLIELDMTDLEYSLDELKDILKQYKLKKKYYRLKDGSFLAINNNYFSTLEQMTEELNLLNQDIKENKVLLPNYRSLHIESLIKNSRIINANRSSDFMSIIRKLTEIKDNDFFVPPSLDGILRNYQITGYKWLKSLSDCSLGGILADDMGLGKTLQIIALLISEISENKPSIVICPTSLIYNWLNEIDKFGHGLKALAITGNKNQRMELINSISNKNLIITSYDLLKKDIDMYINYDFKYCILDEAQYIKNSYTLNAYAVKKIKSESRFALTGTPIENSLSDLWSIFDFIMPGFLLSYSSFREAYEIPVIRDNDENALKRLSNQISPFILRRLKRDVLKELPDKMEFSSYTKMDDKQKRLYQAELYKAREEFNHELNSVGYEKSQIKILSLLTRLRQICCHPSLYIDNYMGKSAKLNLCMEIVRDSIHNGHKILIFSQFTSMLNIIAMELEKEEIQYYLLTGSTKSADRIMLINEFNNNSVPVFLISLKAGGTGLNLTGADIVIHYDPWWNNSAQNQATDRAHRIGQNNKVQVFKLITKDTIEEKIEILQSSKQSLINSVITEKEVFLNTLSKKEIEELFK